MSVYMGNGELQVNIVVAWAASDRIIGYNGKLPWKSKEELKYFRDITSGKFLVMGRKTYESLPANLSTLGRKVCVLSRNKSRVLPRKGMVPYVVKNLNHACKTAWTMGETSITLVGGRSVYELMLPYTDAMYVSVMNEPPFYRGDTCFPIFDPDDWTKEQLYKGHFRDFNAFLYLRKNHEHYKEFEVKNG